ncbi:MAG: SEC-C metal-binding domain-containing protein [Verrucomicrobia bacterium]|nr:SEC-C metal-binding domain-containing protein [Verrucomicrobiota bacterium]
MTAPFQPQLKDALSAPEFDSRLKQAAQILFPLAHALGDEELVSKLSDLGIQLTRACLQEWSGFAGSADEIVRWLRDQGRLKPDRAEDDRLWIWVAITVLWERWFPEFPSFEMVDERINDGYGQTDHREGCREWLNAWQILLRLMERLQIRTLREFDKRFQGIELMQNWVQDLEINLGDVARPEQNGEWFEQRIQFCQQFLSRFNLDDQPLIKHMRRGLAESLFGVGEASRADELFREWLIENPRWGWGWIGWADCYLFAPPTRRDLSRAEELLLQGKAVEGIEDTDVFYERLEHLYEEQGRKDKSAEMRAALNRLKTGGSATLPAPLRRGSPKVGRNDPCPCGSGKKIKKCCGA